MPRSLRIAFRSTSSKNIRSSRFCAYTDYLPRNGLTGDEAAARLAANGLNRLKDVKKVSVFEILLRQVSNSLTFVLAIVMVLSFSLGDWIEGAVVTAVVLVNIVVG